MNHLRYQSLLSPRVMIALALLSHFACGSDTRSFAGTPIDFPSYPAPGIVQDCKKPDFLSSSKARNAEEMIRKNNSDLTKPNFGGKYLLLQIPYMMGSDWLIVDCGTGKFLPEVISGNAEFKLQSFLVRLTEKNSSSWKLWTGSQFVKLEDLKEAQGPSLENSLSARYQSLFSSYPAASKKIKCAPLKYSSYFRAQNAEQTIRNQKNDFSTPNFAGSYLLIRVELLFETIHLIAHCETGIFSPEYRSGEMTFQPGSRIAILTNSGNPPEVLLWEENFWIKRPDTTLSAGNLVFNELAREEARALIKLFPNPHHRSKIEFKDLLCRETDPVQCSFLAPDAKAVDQRIQLLAPPGQETLKTLKHLGSLIEKDGTGVGAVRLDQGVCIPEKSLCRLGTQ